MKEGTILFFGLRCGCGRAYLRGCVCAAAWSLVAREVKTEVIQ
jgi:hypothetical protein